MRFQMLISYFFSDTTDFDVFATGDRDRDLFLVLLPFSASPELRFFCRALEDKYFNRI